jgi:succinyl-diaminopimelate desuccinylase
MDLNKRIDSMKDEIVNSTKELVKFRSIEGKAEPGAPFGKDVAGCLDKALEISKGLGFKTVNLDGYVGYAEYGEGDDYVGILGHLDIVPEGDGWKYPPFAAEVHDGKIYARGTMDDKGPMVAALYGLKAVMDEGVKLSKKVRIIYGTNEETGCGEIKHYLDREKPPVSGFTPDGEYPIIYGEKGITLFDVKKDLKIKPKMKLKYIKGGNRPNMVPDYCEAGIETRCANKLIEKVDETAKETGFELKAEKKDGMVIIKSIGLSAHGSLPQFGKNAIMQMFVCLEKIDLGKSDIMDFITFFNKYAGFETDGKSFGCYLEDKESGKVSFNIGVVDMTEDKITLGLNLRYPVTYKYEDMMNPFNKRLEGTGITVENMKAQNPLFFPADHPLIKALQKVYTEQTGKEATLLAIGGGTYAKEMPNIVAFGPIFPGQPDLDHQSNEYIAIDDLIANAKIYAHAIYELAK